MARQLILDLPDDIYMHLREKARQSGTTPEELVRHWIVIATRGTDDPLEDVIGSLKGHISDWVERHDEYLSKAALEKLT